MKYSLFILGCQQNYYDAQKIAQLLQKQGDFLVSEREAETIIVLACSVRQKPVDRIFGKLKQWQGKKVIVVGCVLPKDKREFQKKGLEVIKTEEIIKELPKIMTVIQRFSPRGKNKNEEYLPIAYGCDNFCSYCAVPFTRGRERFRPQKDVLAEVKNLIKAGAKKITLLGQNVTHYPGFVELLEKIEQITGDFQIEFLSPHPKDFSDKLIEWLGKSKKFSKNLHLPVQSGSDKILKKMNRRYTVAQYLTIVNKLRRTINDLRLTTDLIVGFPGETKKDFEDTIKLCQKVKFAKAYVSQYSPRPGTAAWKMKDDVSPQEKKRRWQILDKLINKSKI